MLWDPDGLFSNLFWKQMLPISFPVHPGWICVLVAGPKEATCIKPRMQPRAAASMPLPPGAAAPNSQHMHPHIFRAPTLSLSGWTQLHLSRPSTELLPRAVSGHKSQGKLPPQCCHPSALGQAKQRRGSRVWVVITI